MNRKRKSPLDIFITEVESFLAEAGLPTQDVAKNIDGNRVNEALDILKSEISDALIKSTQASEGYDPPESARNNARKVLKWKEKYGKECKGMTPVGWARARDLANGARLSASTVKRMASFNRHRSNYEKARNKPEAKSKPWTIPAIVAWLGWGGTSGVEWAIRTSQSIQNKSKKRK